MNHLQLILFLLVVLMVLAGVALRQVKLPQPGRRKTDAQGHKLPRDLR